MNSKTNDRLLEGVVPAAKVSVTGLEEQVAVPAARALLIESMKARVQAFGWKEKDGCVCILCEAARGGNAELSEGAGEKR